MRTKSILCLLGSLVLLAGCNAVKDEAMEGAIEGSAEGEVDVEIDGDSMRMENDEAKVIVGGEMAADWPEDLPLYPGAKVQMSAVTNETADSKNDAVILVTDDTRADVVAYYREQLEANGWKIEATMDAGAMVIIGASKENRLASLSVGEATEGKTSITIGIEDRGM